MCLPTQTMLGLITNGIAWHRGMLKIKTSTARMTGEASLCTHPGGLDMAHYTSFSLNKGSDNTLGLVLVWLAWLLRRRFGGFGRRALYFVYFRGDRDQYSVGERYLVGQEY